MLSSPVHSIRNFIQIVFAALVPRSIHSKSQTREEGEGRECSRLQPDQYKRIRIVYIFEEKSASLEQEPDLILHMLEMYAALVIVTEW